MKSTQADSVGPWRSDSKRPCWSPREVGTSRNGSSARGLVVMKQGCEWSCVHTSLRERAPQTGIGKAHWAEPHRERGRRSRCGTSGAAGSSLGRAGVFTDGRVPGGSFAALPPMETARSTWLPPHPAHPCLSLQASSLCLALYSRAGSQGPGAQTPGPCHPQSHFKTKSPLSLP